MPYIRRTISFVLISGAIAFSTPSTSARHSRTHEVRMVSSSAPRFEPAEIHIAAGDTVVFVLVSGAPHNVAFETTALSPVATRRLRAAVHDTILPFAGPLLMKDNERYAVSFAGMPTGRYPFYCMPHMGLQMRGTVVVE